MTIRFEFRKVFPVYSFIERNNFAFDDKAIFPLERNKSMIMLEKGLNGSHTCQGKGLKMLQ